MAQYDLVIFDVDGTMLDTTEGVLASVKYTIDKFGYDMLSEEQLKSFIGPPVQESFARHYGLSGDILQELATAFRDRYKDIDLLKAVAYNGIYEAFDALRENGIKTAVATYKREDYAITLLKKFSFDRYTDIIFGGDHENKLKKSDIIEKCIATSKVTDKRRVVMIGDTLNDAVGAEKIGVDFIAVTYGFGFKSEADLNNTSYVGCADTPMGVLDFIV